MAYKIVYVATRDPSYSRVTIVDRGLSAHFHVQRIVSYRRHYLWRFLEVAAKLLYARITGKWRDVDAVFVGFMAQPILPLVRVLWRGTIVCDAFFSLYDTMVYDKRRAKPGSLLARVCFWLDRMMVQHADLCFTDTNEHAAYFRETFGPGQARLVRLWVSATDKPLPTRRANESTTTNVFFWGNYIPLQGVETIVQAAHELSNEDVAFTLTGRGQTRAACEQLCRDLGVSSIRFVDWMTLDEINQQAHHSDVALGIFGATPKAARVIPNKVYQALAMGIPVITRNSPAAAELLRDGHDALLIDAASPLALADAIRWVRDHRNEAEAMAVRGQQTFNTITHPVCVARILHDELSPLLEADDGMSRVAADDSTPPYEASSWQPLDKATH